MRDVQSDEEVVRRVVAGEVELFELLVRRHNQRLFRAVRSIVRNDADAEDALQVAYVNAWRRLETFGERAKFTTWMTRIALRTASEVARSREQRADFLESDERALDAEPTPTAAPDQDITRREVAKLLEQSIDELPELYRVVFVLRMLEENSTADVATHLGLTEAAVKVRLHRARELLRNGLLQRAVELGALEDTWSIGGERCDRIVQGVFARIRPGK